MNTTRRIHLNPQSKGNLGKSFEAEFRTAWLDKLGVPWNGSDLDDRHHTFANRHPQVVRSYHLGNEQESKTALLSLFRRVLKDSAPVHIIDTRAQADALILGALEELQVLDVCAEQGVRLTFLLFPTDDTESMTNAGRLFLYAGDRVDYVIVNNPAKARGDLFKGSQLEKQLKEFGAKSVTLPVVTPTTLLAIEKAEAIAKRGLCFAELSHVEAGHLERLLAGEIQWAMQKMFRQYDAIADLLLPTEFVPKEKSAPAKEKAKTEPQPQLNFGEQRMEDTDFDFLCKGLPAEESKRMRKILAEWSDGDENGFPVQLAMLTRAQWRAAALVPQAVNQSRKLSELHLAEYRRQTKIMLDDFSSTLKAQSKEFTTATEKHGQTIQQPDVASAL